MDSNDESEEPASQLPATAQKAIKKATQKAVKAATEKAESTQRTKNISDDDRTTIIGFVRNNPCLYDLSDPDYKDGSKRSGLWAKLGVKVGLSG